MRAGPSCPAGRVGVHADFLTYRFSLLLKNDKHGGMGCQVSIRGNELIWTTDPDRGQAFAVQRNPHPSGGDAQAEVVWCHDAMVVSPSRRPEVSRQVSSAVRIARAAFAARSSGPLAGMPVSTAVDEPGSTPSAARMARRCHD